MDEDNNVIDSNGDQQSLEPQYDSYWDWFWGTVSDLLMEQVSEWIDCWILEVSSDFDKKDVEFRDYPVKSNTPF